SWRFIVLATTVACGRSSLYPPWGGADGSVSPEDALADDAAPPPTDTNDGARDATGDALADQSVDAPDDCPRPRGSTLVAARSSCLGTTSPALALGDVDQDGAPDLAFVDGSVDMSAAHWIGVALGNGDGTFRAPVRTPVLYQPARLVLADLDGDGRLDVA